MDSPISCIKFNGEHKVCKGLLGKIKVNAEKEIKQKLFPNT